MFHLFAGHNYYPGAALDDYVGPFSTTDEAIKEGRDSLGTSTTFGNDWYVVVTERDGRLVEVASGTA